MITAFECQNMEKMFDARNDWNAMIDSVVFDTCPKGEEMFNIGYCETVISPRIARCFDSCHDHVPHVLFAEYFANTKQLLGYDGQEPYSNGEKSRAGFGPRYNFDIIVNYLTKAGYDVRIEPYNYRKIGCGTLNGYKLIVCRP